MRDGHSFRETRFRIAPRQARWTCALAIVAGWRLFDRRRSAGDRLTGFDDLKRLVDQQQQQIRQMQDQMARLQATPRSQSPAPPADTVRVPADFAPTPQGDGRRSRTRIANKPDEGYVVGSDLSTKTEFPQRPVSLVRDAEQRFHDAHRRLGAMGQRLV